MDLRYYQPRYFICRHLFYHRLWASPWQWIYHLCNRGRCILGMATAFGANPAIVAGAVISGALFGDKMSPLSDTTSIAASLVGVDLFDHIKI